MGQSTPLLLNVSYTANSANGTPELNFSVSVIAGSNIGQVLLFGVNVWDQDGYVESSAPNFVPFQNPTSPPYGTIDAFKCTWIGQGNAFNNGTLSGFKVLLASQYAPGNVEWFAFVTLQNTPLPILITGNTNATNAPNAPIAPTLSKK